MKGELKDKITSELFEVLRNAPAFKDNPAIASVWASKLYDQVLFTYFFPLENATGVATITESGEVFTKEDSPLRKIFEMMPDPKFGGVKSVDVVPVTAPFWENKEEDMNNKLKLNHFGDGMNEHIVPHTLEEADKLCAWADGYIFRSGWDSAKKWVEARHEATTATKAYEYARLGISTEFHDSKDREFPYAPEMQSFANGVTEGLSKALMIMNQLRPEK